MFFFRKTLDHELLVQCTKENVRSHTDENTARTPLGLHPSAKGAALYSDLPRRSCSSAGPTLCAHPSVTQDARPGVTPTLSSLNGIERRFIK